MVDLIPPTTLAMGDKMRRLSAHFKESEGQVIVFDVPNHMMTGTQMRKEREEFDKIV